MKFGSTDLGKKLIVAPMAEVSDAAFRKISKKFGCGMSFTQMVSAAGVINDNFETLRLLAFGREEAPVGVQILGNDPDILYAAVKEIARLKPSVIDLNCGCPIDKVTSKKMGASILEDPKLLGRLVKSMSSASEGLPISVKLRLGKDKNNINILENSQIAEDNGASFIVIHGRTKSDQYSTEADWSWIKKVKEAVSIPVVGNGSVFTPQDAFDMINKTNCDSVMIARGALGNPFFFSRFNSLVETGTDPGIPSVQIIRDTVLEHIDLLSKEFGEFKALTPAKKHIIWYFKFLDGINYLLNDIFQVSDTELLKKLIIVHCDKIERNKFPSENVKEINKKFKNRVLFWLNNKSNDSRKAAVK